jgi:hypothetical protein
MAGRRVRSTSPSRGLLPLVFGRIVFVFKTAAAADTADAAAATAATNVRATAAAAVIVSLLNPSTCRYRPRATLFTGVNLTSAA